MGQVLRGHLWLVTIIRLTRIQVEMEVDWRLLSCSDNLNRWLALVGPAGLTAAVAMLVVPAGLLLGLRRVIDDVDGVAALRGGLVVLR